MNDTQKDINISLVPRHIAIIMDGNGRWAKARGKDRSYGHAKGVESVRTILKYASNRGVKVLTLYTFSEENWYRPQDEVMALMSLLVQSLQKEADELMKNNVRLCCIGNIDKLPDAVQTLLNEVIRSTAENDGIVLQLALSYSSRSEIIHAIKALMESHVSTTDLNETVFERYLYTAGIPDPDLIIRTGGEMRLSNFLLWQAAYSELYYCDEAWPDFNEVSLEKAINSYSERERRFGKTSEQVLNEND